MLNEATKIYAVECYEKNGNKKIEIDFDECGRLFSYYLNEDYLNIDTEETKDGEIEYVLYFGKGRNRRIYEKYTDKTTAEKEWFYYNYDCSAESNYDVDLFLYEECLIDYLKSLSDSYDYDNVKIKKDVEKLIKYIKINKEK